MLQCKTAVSQNYNAGEMLKAASHDQDANSREYA